MKEKLFLSIIITILVIQTILQIHAFVEDETIQLDIKPNSSIIPDQTDLHRPLFENITNNGELIRERNDTLGNGAIYKAYELNKNVTIIYSVVNGDNETDLRLFADNAGNLTLTRAGTFDNQSLHFKYLTTTSKPNYTVPYTETFYVNASISYYEVQLNVTTNYIPFYGAVGTNDVSEDEGNYARNLITTNQTWSTESQDDFYIQFERVNITISVKNATDSDVYGINYRISTKTEWTEMNFTLPVLISNVTSVIDLGDFPIDTTLEWISYAYLNDTVQNETRFINDIEHKFVDIGDGTPNLKLSVSSAHSEFVFINNTIYSQTPEISFNFSASVRKGNISEFRFLTGLINQSIQPTENASLLGDSMNTTYTFEDNSIINATISAITNKDLIINVTYTIVIDNVKPIFTLNTEGIGKVTSNDGLVKFNFNFSDTTAKVRYAILDLDDDTSIEVTYMKSYTHKYLEFDRTYVVTLTVIDWAGNIDNTQVLVELSSKALGTTSSPNLEVYLLIIGIILLVTSPLYGSKLLNQLENIRK